jgi:hypothetical protein
MCFYDGFKTGWPALPAVVGSETGEFTGFSLIYRAVREVNALVRGSGFRVLWIKLMEIHHFGMSDLRGCSNVFATGCSVPDAAYEVWFPQ